jgi:hypothetical protein
MADCSSSDARTRSAIRPFIDALNCCNELREIQRAYSALVNFIAPEFDQPHAEVQASRSEMCALMAMLNAEAGRRIETAIQTLEAACEGATA